MEKDSLRDKERDVIMFFTTSSHAQVNTSMVEGWRAHSRKDDTTRLYPTGWRFKELGRKFWRMLVRIKCFTSISTVVKPLLRRMDISYS